MNILIKENEEKKTFVCFWKKVLITYNFYLTQNFDFSLTNKIWLNWLQSTRNQCWYTFDDIKKLWKFFDFIDFSGL